MKPSQLPFPIVSTINAFVLENGAYILNLHSVTPRNFSDGIRMYIQYGKLPQEHSLFKVYYINKLCEVALASTSTTVYFMSAGGWPHARS